jgi:hypothetical protein
MIYHVFNSSSIRSRTVSCCLYVRHEAGVASHDQQAIDNSRSETQNLLIEQAAEGGPDA